MKKFYAMAITLILLLPSLVLPAQETEVTKIKDVFGGYSNTRLYFSVAGTIMNPAGCASADDLYAVDPSNADVRAFLAMLLMAQATQKDVTLLVSTEACYKNRPVATRLKILGD